LTKDCLADEGSCLSRFSLLVTADHVQYLLRKFSFMQSIKHLGFLVCFDPLTRFVSYFATFRKEEFKECICATEVSQSVCLKFTAVHSYSLGGRQDTVSPEVIL
jgi:hypothetical protein